MLLEVGRRDDGIGFVDYPDIDLQIVEGRAGYARKDGTPYKT